MNKKGFTLIELLAVIVLIGIVGIIVVPSVIDDLKTSKDKAYEILVKNIKIAAENYYQECEYGDLSDVKYGSYACIITSNTISTTIGTLANTGMLSASDDDGNKIVKNPKTNANINVCSIKITKSKTDKGKVTYTVTNTGGPNCPSY